MIPNASERTRSSDAIALRRALHETKKANLTKAARFSFANALRRYSIEHADITVRSITRVNGNDSQYLCRVSTRTRDYSARATVLVEIQGNIYDTACELHRVRMPGSKTDAILVRSSPIQIEARQLQ